MAALPLFIVRCVCGGIPCVIVRGVWLHSLFVLLGVCVAAFLLFVRVGDDIPSLYCLGCVAAFPLCIVRCVWRHSLFVLVAVCGGMHVLYCQQVCGDISLFKMLGVCCGIPCLYC